LHIKVSNTCKRFYYFFAEVQPVAPITSTTTQKFISTQAPTDATVLTSGENNLLQWKLSREKRLLLDLCWRQWKKQHVK